jgi:uroporphyrinogen decarboxylase
MKPRERVLTAISHREPDAVPRFEIWINDEIVSELGYGDLQNTHAKLGLDCIMIPTRIPAGSNYWKDGLDEFGQIWKDGVYVDGVVDSEADIRRYRPPLEYARKFFEVDKTKKVMKRYPDHFFIYGSHIGPFTMGYMGMGFKRFFLDLHERPELVQELLEARTEWCIAICREATRLGVDLIVLGDDAGHRNAPMVSPRMWREYVLPLHRRIVEQLNVPVIWHSDGAIQSLLSMAIEARFAGVHGLEPAAGIDLGEVKRTFGEDLVLVGNVDVRVLCDSDLDAVRGEVARCVKQAAPGGGYMISSCNSLFRGMKSESIVEMYRYARTVGYY